MSFEYFTTREVQLRFEARPDPVGLSDQELFWIARQERLLSDRDGWEVYYQELRDRVESYNSDFENQTPFALRGYSGIERQMILLNLKAIEDSFGCPNACSWCGRNAPRVAGKDLTLMPIEHQTHLWGERMGLVADVTEGIELQHQLLKGAVRGVLPWDMADPMSNSALLERMVMLQREYGAVQRDLVTAVPVHTREDVAKRFVDVVSQQYDLVRNFDCLEGASEVKDDLVQGEWNGEEPLSHEWEVKMFKLGGFMEVIQASEYVEILRNFRRFIEVDTFGHTREQVVLLIKFFEEQPWKVSLREVLAFFGLGDPYDYIENTDLLTDIINVHSELNDFHSDCFDDLADWVKAIDFLGPYFERIYGYDILEMPLTAEVIADFKEKAFQVFAKEGDSLLAIPDLSNQIQFSCTAANASFLRELRRKYRSLRINPKDSYVGAPNPDWEPYDVGVGYFGASTEKKGSDAGGTHHGMVLTAVGLMNTVERLNSHSNYQCARLEVPYEGLKPGLPLARYQQGLAPILKNVIVFMGQNLLTDFDENYGHIMVFDGDARIRHICFRRNKPYQVVWDKVVAENVDAIDQQRFQFRGSIWENCATCKRTCFGLLPKGYERKVF